MNKIRFTLVILLSLITIFSSAQQKKNKVDCGFEFSEEDQIHYQSKLLELKAKMEKNKSKTPTASTYTIPVVFHILTDPGISQQEMQCRTDDAILVLNDDYNGLNPDFNTVDPRFDGIKAIMDIEFCAATIDPSGNTMATPGMDWQTSANITYGYDNGIYDHIWWGMNGKYYLDIIVVAQPNDDDGTTNQSGHAFFPTSNTIPHIAYNYTQIGRTCGSWAGDGFASTMSHEVGHILGLLHTFQGGCSGNGDNISDTPPTTGSDGCNDNTLGDCGSEYVNVENYMDYNYQCYAMFTQEQVSVMTGWLTDMSTAVYPRGNLIQPSNLTATGCSVDGPPIADFTVDNTSLCIGENVSFSDASGGGAATSWSWTFTGGSPATSSSQNPSVTYNSSGSYSVTLTVTNSFGTDSKTITDFVNVGIAGTLPYAEGFENGFLPAGWSANNPDGGLQWAHRTDAGRNSSNSMGMNNADNSVVGEIDETILGPLNFSGSTSTQMTFDVAYTGFDANSPDQLRVFASKDCGSTWSEVWMKTHSDLKTYPADGSYLTDAAEKNSWAPSTDAHWRNELVDLSAYDGESYVQLKFQNTSGYGTWIYVDNINIQQSLGLKKNKEIAFNVFPNPSKDGIYNLIMYTNTNGSYMVEVKNILGQQIYNERIPRQQIIIDLSDHKNGVYVLIVSDGDKSVMKKVVKN